MSALLWLKVILVIAFVTWLFSAAGYFIFGIPGLIGAQVLSVVVHSWMYMYGDELVLRWYRARILPRRDYASIYEIAERLASRAGIPTPDLALIPTGTPDVFSTGGNQKRSVIVLTHGILHTLESDELEAVMSHEIAHILSGETPIQTLTVVMVGSVVGFAYWLDALIHPADSVGRGAGDYRGGLMLTAPIAAGILHFVLGRELEYRADAMAAEISGRPLSLASAMLKMERAISFRPMKCGNLAAAPLFIVNPYRGEFADLVSTHPQTGKRVERLMKLAEETGAYS
ncbi:M48 family metalloprotease [Thermococcus camini]|uniref:Protease HtpX homolog n=1 Tax=Thermococcus camini TaxID=2016373 RepID=A0A7G2D7V9_9EURY|nr:M48 family metalloprotease [Thermococcus camini]CAD5244094.1 Protease HtpX homolog [Thermococcus camini]